jgi:outer membrane protein TolC
MKSRRISLVMMALSCLFVSPLWAKTITLQECLEQAVRNNPDVKTATWDTRLAEENVRQAMASRYPVVDSQIGYTFQQAAQGVRINGITAATQQPDFAFGGLSATYTIYDFGRRYSRLQRARANADSSVHVLETYLSELSLQVIETYFGILEANRIVAASEEEVARMVQHRRVAQTFFEEGVVTRNDVLQADVRLAGARHNLLAARNRRENSWLQLNFLTGAEQGFRGDLDEAATITADENINLDDSSIYANRPEIRALRKTVEAGEAEVKESSSNFYPELYSRLALDYVQNDKVSEQSIMSATIGIKMNIFDGFATSSTRERAVISRSRTQDALRQMESRLRLEVTTAQNDMRVAQERIGVTSDAIRQSEENLRINNEKYLERVSTATEALDAQTLLTQTKTDYYRALFDFQVASARLKRAIGKL